MIQQKDIAAALGVSEATISDYVRRGMPTDSMEAAAAWRAANVRQRAGGGHRDTDHQADEGAMQYSTARAMREAEEALMARMKREEMEGALIRVDAVRMAVAGTLAATREALLQIPARMATVLAAEASSERVHDLLRQELYQALAQLTALPGRWKPAGGADDDLRGGR